jgi:two-component system sensor kinase
MVATAERPFDVVLMDMQMPVMDGYAASGALRQRGYDGPIIAMTANAMVGDDVACREAGCSEYLTKPLDLNRLLQLVRSAGASPDSDCETSDEPPPPATLSETGHSAMADPQTAVDPAADTEVLSGDTESLLPEEALALFAEELLSQVHEVLPEMIDGCRASQWDQVAQHAHRIKGSGGTVGLDELSRVAERCESAALGGDAEQVLQTLRELQQLAGYEPSPSANAITTRP